ncbi:competence type IV pilus minor pilin ComGG [Streptococcus caviae]|uniref:competence type IV pilus minor pilin ComGG n=1 Tax=Streptococcus sp. 'caviae' TaxID=1915004 RepID=UPI00094BC65A|nr:competence type IV pilus minor pilin ComGG [Streptococcus sp. 'caviae']OLN83123.1 hypothetical protein BMI76_05935 [Streptococcus sp. 'caviae']
MHLTKKVKAGVLLYALLMAAIFSLLLQFYLNRVLATQRQNQLQLSASQAYLMAELTQDLAKDNSGQFTFNYGSSSYQKENQQIVIEVRLKSGRSYRYHFKEESDKTKEETAERNFEKEKTAPEESKEKRPSQTHN